MSPGIMALIMLAILVLAIMIGFPVAFTMMALAVGFGYYAYFQPGTDFFDNRVKQDQNMLEGKPIGPDWKCKNDNCQKKYYRPGSYQYNQAFKGGGAPAPVPTAPPMAMQQPPHPHPPMHLPPEDVRLPALEDEPPPPEYGPDEEPF